MKLFFIGFSLVLLFCASSAIRSANAATLDDFVKPLIEAHPGDVAVSIKNLDSGVQFVHQADKPMPTASLIKFPILIETYRQIQKGKLALSKKLRLTDADKVPGSGVLTHHFSEGTEITLRDALNLMIAFSDNTATNLVIDQIGLAATSETMNNLGCPNTKLHAKVFRRDTSIAPDRSRKFGLGSTTANEMLSLLERIHHQSIYTPEICQKLLTHLSVCEDRTKLARFLPENIEIAHKTGAVAKSRTDAGLISTPNGTIAICVLTNENNDKSWSDDNEANLLCGRIAKAAFDFFNAEYKSSAVTLTSGNHGELVETLQRTLNARLNPSPNLSIDGDFGPMTQNAVTAFQRQERLPADGIVDAKTWRALSPLVTSGPPVPEPDSINNAVIPKQMPDALHGVPFVSCKGWIIHDAATGKLIGGENQHAQLHPASVTKVMTAYVVLRLAAENPDILKQTVTFSERADNTIGSTAAIRTGESLSVFELLHGLLLPSGNDAAVAFAEHFGKQISPQSDAPSYDRFIQAMNATAAELGMKNTTYANPHGLTVATHLTTAHDQAVLARHAMQIPLFRRIVSTGQRGCTVDGKTGYTRNVLWKNTNRLLARKGYDGIKTGTTEAAGACLVSQATREDKSLIMVVLGSSSSDARYVDSRNLYRWAWNHLGDPSKHPSSAN